jgi:tetratricopeptide (TPR) repeat protein
MSFPVACVPLHGTYPFCEWQEERGKKQGKAKQGRKTAGTSGVTVAPMAGGARLAWASGQPYRHASQIQEETEEPGQMCFERQMQTFDQRVTTIWSLLAAARILQAREAVERLLLLIQRASSETDVAASPPELEMLAHAYHVAGYTASLSERNREAFVVFPSFQEMKRLADGLHQETLSVIARSYEGDAYMRMGQTQQARRCLQQAHRQFPAADAAARGHCAQLLGRVSFRLDDSDTFRQMMREAEDLARAIDPVKNSLHGHYHLGTVYMAYARSYQHLGQWQQSLDYLHRAEAVVPPSPYWQAVIRAARGTLLVRSGDVRAGMPLVIEAVTQGKEHGQQRLLEQCDALRRFLHEKQHELHAASDLLAEALDVPVLSSRQ